MRGCSPATTHGYYADFAGTIEELARTIRQGWLFTGPAVARIWATPRGTDPSRVPMRRFVVCLQNHDQIGNRAVGDRLHHADRPAAWRAASALLLTAPMTPLLFMGQEWAASTPFQFFTDLEPELGAAGHRRPAPASSPTFPEFSNEEARDRIPDPQVAVRRFDDSRLDWDERVSRRTPQCSHSIARCWRCGSISPALGGSRPDVGRRRCARRRIDRRPARGDRGKVFWVVARLKGSGPIDLSSFADARGDEATNWKVVLSTEEPLFALDPAPPQIRHAGPGAGWSIFRGRAR